MTLARQIGHDRRDSIIEEAPGGGDEFKVLAVRRNRISCNAIKRASGQADAPRCFDTSLTFGGPHEESSKPLRPGTPPRDLCSLPDDIGVRHMAGDTRYPRFP